jgi:hypothetical protein
MRPASIALAALPVVGLLGLAEPAAGSPLFAAPFMSYDTGDYPAAVAIEDFDGDGLLDLAVASSHSVSVLRGNGDGSFDAKTDFEAGFGAAAIACGDLDNDGRLDLAVANQGSETVSVLLGLGAGTFAPHVDFATGPASSVAIGDLNGDGRADLVVANVTGSVSILLGIGAGTFAPRVDLSAAVCPMSVAIGDLNADGSLDLAVTYIYPGGVSIFLGNGDGTFRARTNYRTGADASSVAIGDFNADGRPDLAVANFASHTISVLPGNGDGTFGARVDLLDRWGPGAVVIADVNTDGNADLVVANETMLPDRWQEGGWANGSVLLGHGDGSFGPSADFETGMMPTLPAVGDLNRDGRPDVVVPNSFSPGTVSVLLGNGDGSFGRKNEFDTGVGPVAMGLGDLDADGKVDVVTANGGSTSKSVSVLRGNGDGTCGAKTDFACGGYPDALAIGDLNEDRKLDLVVASRSSNDLSVFLGCGDGSFGTASAFGAGDRPFAVVIGDFNRDGKPDLAVANFQPLGSVSVLLGNGDGSFGAKTDFGTGNGFISSIAAGDLNADGKVDLVATTRSADKVAVLLGNGDGTFGFHQDFEAGRAPEAVAIGDLNGDDKLDLAVAVAGIDTIGCVSVLLGTGDGSFAERTLFPAGGGPSSVAIGDLDRDGAPDLVVTTSGDNTVSVLLGSGGGNFGPKTEYGTGYLPTAVTIADFNADGRPDLAVANELSSTVGVLLANSVSAVSVTDLEATASAGHVSLRWRLSSEALRQLQSVTVQRATAAAGPYVSCSASALEPAATMHFEEAELVSGTYWYRVELVSRGGKRWYAGPVSVQAGTSTGRKTALHQPFEVAGGGPVQIGFSVAGSRTVTRIAIYDVRGSLVWASERRVRDPGEYSQSWDRRDESGALAPRGVYFVRLEAGPAKATRKLVLLHP